MKRIIYSLMTLAFIASTRADINTDISQFMQGREAAPSIGQDYIPVQSYTRQPDGRMKKTVEMLPSPRYGNGGIDMYTAPDNSKTKHGVALFVQGYSTGASL